MAQDVSVLVNADDRARLAAIAGRGSRPHRHVVRIILQSAERLPVQEVARSEGRVGGRRPKLRAGQRRDIAENILSGPPYRRVDGASLWRVAGDGIQDRQFLPDRAI
jgi:hypothetical protein